MLTVHHLENSRSQRVLWLLEELGLPYELKRYPRDPATMLAPAALRQIHPLGKSPIVTDGSVVLAETGAIIEELIDRAGGALRPAAGTDELRRWRYWLHAAEGSAMPPLVMALVFGRMRAAPAPFFIRPVARMLADKATALVVTPNIERMLDLMEAELTRSAWFAGAGFSAADVMMSFPVEAARQRAGLDASRPKLMQWLSTIHARPAYQRALARGGPYAYAERTGG